MSLAGRKQLRHLPLGDGSYLDDGERAADSGNSYVT